MAWECSTRLINERGRGIGDVKVNITFSFWTGFDSARTDGDGWATFSYDNIDKDELYAKTIWVTLSLFPSQITKTLAEETTIENGETMSFTLTEDDWRG